MQTKLVIVPAAFLAAVAGLACNSSNGTAMGAAKPGTQTTTKPAAGTSAGTDPGTSGAKPASTGGAAGKSGSSPTTGGGAAGASAPSSSAGGSGAASTGPKMGVTPVDMTFPDPRGGCNIDSGFPGDDACILPPAADEGMQIHVGPTDYKDMAQIATFTIKPGQETESCWTFHTPNDKKIFYQSFVLSARAGTHHIINSMYKIEIADGGFTMCMDGGTGTNSNIIDNLPGASKPYMPRAVVAPENMDIGRSIPPKTASQADMHSFNFTDKDALREFWMNIYFIPEAQVKREASQIRAMGGLSWSVFPIAPGTDMTYSYQCAIDTDGRIMALLGHYHAHGKKFTATVKHASGDMQKVFEMYDYLDPAEFQYDTITKNPDFSASAAGAVSGILDVKAGDTLLWDCHVVNDSNVGLTYTNQVKTGEMCNLWGQSIGPKINCVVP